MEKVCILTSVHPPFDGRIFHREAKSLARAGYDVTLIAPTQEEQVKEDGITILGVPPPASRLRRPLVWLQLYRQVRRLSPDAVHLHDPELLLLVPLFRLAFGRRLKLVYDVHEYFALHVANKYWIPAWLRPGAAWVVKRLERLLTRGVDGIICAVDGQMPIYDGFQGTRAVVRNYPFASLFAEAEPIPDLDVTGFRLIYVGLILPERGIDEVLEAMRLVHASGARDIHLFLIGPEISPAYIAEIQTFAQRHGLGDKIRWLGYVPHQQLKDYLASADVGLVPGQAVPQYSQPGITTKLFEYLLCSLPVISVDYPHRRVYVEESNCGLLVPSGDAAAHADAFLWMRDHPDETQAMGKRGREMVETHYTWEREETHLLAFYRELLGPLVGSGS